jgi:hypothetical protein
VRCTARTGMLLVALRAAPGNVLADPITGDGEGRGLLGEGLHQQSLGG